MKPELKKISIWLSPHHIAHSVGTQKAALLNAAVTLLVASFLAIYGIIFFYLCGLHAALWGYISSFVLSFGSIEIYRRKGSLRASINYLISVSLYSLIYATYFTGGLSSPALIWLVAVPTVGGNLLKERDKFLWGSITCVVFGSFYVLTAYDFPFPNIVPEQFKTTYLFLTLASALVGSLACILVFDRDIQELLEHSLDQEKRIRTLLRTVLHDLANPLAVISGAYQILANTSQLNEKSTKWWQTIARALNQMQDILEKMRDLEKIKSKKIAINVTPVSLSEAIQGAISGLQNQIKAKELQLRYEPSSCTEVTVLADAITLANQVIANVLTNAIKFSAKGDPIDIQVANEGLFIRLVIHDHGVGIPPEMLKLFRKNGELLSREGTSGEKGTGFGLPIVKAFVEMYGGWMEIESRCIEQHPDAHGTKITIFARNAKSNDGSKSRLAA